MKKFVLFFVLLTVFNAFPQSTKYGLLTKESWNFGFGVTYPRYISTSSGQRTEGNYGGYLSIQRNYTEHLGLRLEGQYLHFGGSANPIIVNNSITANIDILYYFVPCEPISPFLVVGLGGTYYTIEKSPTPKLNDSFLDYQFNFGFGVEYRIGERWKLKPEIGYHTTASSKFDGTYGTDAGGLLGGQSDSYMRFDLGFLYYFGLGEKSNICEIYEGLGKVDYEQIEVIVKKYVVEPTEVDYDRIEDIIKKNAITGVGSGMGNDNWVLIGINFETGSSKIKPESIPILYLAAEVLLTNPDVNVEIQGHTDYIGSDAFNNKLSLKRAEAVKMFLVAKGVGANRLSTVGMGESAPIMDNGTPEGRLLNRRIEFKLK